MSTSRFPMNHAVRVLQIMLSKAPSLGPAHHLIILNGAKTTCRDDTDREMPFRQESNFAYLTGCEVPGAAFSLSYEHEGGADIDETKLSTVLHLPAVDPDEVMWCGLPPSTESLAKGLQFTAIRDDGWTPAQLTSQKPNNSKLSTYIHTLPWSPFQSFVATINGPKHVASKYLTPALHEARRNKTEREMALMRKANDITSKAHAELMKAVGNGSAANEGEAEAVFVAACRKRGAKHQAYTPIMASGSSAGTLHYVANDNEFPSTPGGSLILVDAGAEYQNYAGDVTRCIPIGNNGRFTKECREIYELVLEMQEAAFKVIRPGADWEGIQKLMHEVVARGLLKLGIFKARPGGEKSSEDEVVAEIVKSGLTTAFYPHGVGHLLGLDVHDVGGLPAGKSTDPLLRYLRLRVPLEVGFVVTVEPGCYFNEYLFAACKNSPYVNHEVLDRYWYVGGVRIEDNVLVTADGFENLTTAPKTVQEVEALTSSS